MGLYFPLTNCSLFSFCQPGLTTALEFEDGKVMLGKMGSIHSVSWSNIKQLIGLDKLISCFEESSLICMVNWGELDNSTSIWQGILNDIIPNIKPLRRIMLFDLADCSKRGKNDIICALYLIKKYCSIFKVILSMNENEARSVYCTKMFVENEPDLASIGARLYNTLSVDTLVIHTNEESICWDSTGLIRMGTFHIKNPKISTGGGDNFNAGFCLGQLTGCDTYASVLLANSVSSLYVKNGYSPDIEQLTNFLLSIE